MMTVAVIAALLAAAAAPRALPASRPVLLVTVQQESREPFDARALRDMDADVRRAWRPYADVSLRDATDPLVAAADDVLTLVITDRRSASGDGLGWIEFAGNQPSHTIYVSRGEAVRLATQGRWAGREMTDWPPKVQQMFLRKAMGLAIAHEVGHYLLRSKAHAATGLMRARFTVADLMTASPASYRLDADAQSILRQRIRAYLVARVSESASGSRAQ